MAKRGRSDDEGGKIEFVFVKLEGSNETIQQTVKTIADAIKPSAVIVRPPLLPAEERRVLSAIEHDEAEEVLVEPVEASSPKTPKKKSPGRARNAARPPEPLDLDLTSGEVPFKEFVRQKNPGSDAERYVLIADWLKTYRNISPITKAHIYTCYQVMSWSAPEDLNQVFRSLKNKDFRQYGAGEYEITVVGKNRIIELDQS